ncbi:phenylacetate--CoA ligase family protein [Methanococcus maripaludis]|uniref:Coenzyme F390 synthetase n=1 Tax=Methanococcus maripaludis (strain DSM 14266 / JCM 13030 / NBRC 101832 / S2 / LL) TaxID=267377 RepID=Q6M0V8_METMP|nr:phenylacetate--CoA ligase [Methanococcus maripaludis]CAF29716.1 coenzyme F390 synthetase [Methanococcus maripaludis S2]
MIWSKEETWDRKEIEKIQLERLKESVKRAYENVPLYKEKFDSVGLKPEDIKSLDDLKKIPFTVKDDFRANYPFGMFAVPKKEVVRIHASSGTTGKPTVVGYTKKDIRTWAELISRVVTAAGVTDDDTAQIAFGYGLFTGGFGLHYGLENVGASVIPMSSGNTEKQIMLMKDFETTVLICTPSYALYIAEVAEKMGIDPKKDLKVRIGLFGGEACSESARTEIESKWGILATQNYGMSELMGPGVSGDCEYQCGMHISEDHFIAEIIDPKTGEVLPEGEIGELVITTLTKEALPVLRYRTKDMTSLTYEKCKCGRTTARMLKIRGRSDDMLIIRGVNVFPTQIESVLEGIEEIGPHYEIIVTKNGHLDQMTINIELADGKFLEKFSCLEQISKKVDHKLKTVLGLSSKINIVQPRTLERFEGKAKRVKDLRNVN